MWLVLAPRPAKVAVVWPGRRVLAVADAIAWPLILMALIESLRVFKGVLGIAFLALALLALVTRTRRAVFANPYYRFTTARWGSVVAWLLAFGFLAGTASLLR